MSHFDEGEKLEDPFGGNAVFAGCLCAIIMICVIATIIGLIAHGG